MLTGMGRLQGVAGPYSQLSGLRWDASGNCIAYVRMIGRVAFCPVLPHH